MQLDGRETGRFDQSKNSASNTESQTHQSKLSGSSKLKTQFLYGADGCVEVLTGDIVLYAGTRVSRREELREVTAGDVARTYKQATWTCTTSNIILSKYTKERANSIEGISGLVLDVYVETRLGSVFTNETK